MGLKDEVVVASDPPEEPVVDESNINSNTDKNVDDGLESSSPDNAESVETVEGSIKETEESEKVSEESEKVSEEVVEETSEEISESQTESTETGESTEEQEEEEEDLVDPQDTLKESCGSSGHCAHLKEELEKCNERVEGRTKTEETCAQELYDFMHCVDHCVSQSLFSHLK